MELYGKFEDKSLITEVLVAMPARVENTLIYYRTKILGRSPQTETPMIQDPGGDRVMVLDLPENWKDEEFRDLISTTSSDEE